MINRSYIGDGLYVYLMGEADLWIETETGRQRVIITNESFGGLIDYIRRNCPNLTGNDPQVTICEVDNDIVPGLVDLCAHSLKPKKLDG